MNLETLLEQNTRTQIEQELLAKGYTNAFLRSKSKAELAQILLDTFEGAREAVKPKKRIPKCEAY
ncbi:MAG: hypothetical protein K2N45_05550 [Helicobacter japonicus]|nr:hypothetical protein [Helicobacter japonicus]